MVMKISSSKKISILLALIISLISFSLWIVFKSVLFENQIIYALLAFTFYAIIMYLLIYYIINKYVVKKIKTLVETINAMKISDNEVVYSLGDRNFMNDIDRKVIAWARDRVDEIDILKANEKYRKEFLGDVSHELKTPLFNIQGYISTLIEGGLHDNTINLKYLKRTDKNINRLISIVNELETISRLEKGERLLEYTDFDMVQLINEVFEMNELRAKRKNIELKFNNKSLKKLMVRADKRSILDVLGNLIVNSIVYGKEGGTTTVSLDSNPDKVFVNVEDNGIGIEEKYFKRIFERFFRIDKSRSKIQGGTGLGLAIVKHTIEAHRQTITLKSKLGIGSKFTFSLEKVK